MKKTTNSVSPILSQYLSNKTLHLPKNKKIALQNSTKNYIGDILRINNKNEESSLT